METPGDKMVTTAAAPPDRAVQTAPQPPQDKRTRKASKGGRPVAVARFGSVAVPVYRCGGGGRTRFVLSYHREGRRMRRSFVSLEKARKEALLVAQRIQGGLQHVTDMAPHDRDAYAASVRLLGGTGVPLVAAIQEYVAARRIAANVPLTDVAATWSRHFARVVPDAPVPGIVAGLLEAKARDGAGRLYIGQLRANLNRFALRFPGRILDVTAGDIDAWLRSLSVSNVSRNSVLTSVKVLFSFARSQGYLPEDQATAASKLRKLKVVDDAIEVFTPEQMRTILHAAPPHLVPILAIGAFAGIRMAELARLDWDAVDLERRIIQVRAGQAKTASRRVIPVTDNLAAWLAPLPRRGKVVASSETAREVTALARSVGIAWPRNVLRHSFISYRIAIVKSADQVALEAGNSPSIIFRHYRELVTEDVANEWFAILPE